MRLTSVFIPIVALTLAGCMQTGADAPPLAFGGAMAAPKAIYVSDFVFASEVVAMDRGYSTRLERKIGSFPTYQRKQRTNERVNDEIVATIIATLREAGIAARAGSEESLSLDQTALIVAGRLHPAEGVSAKQKNSIGFGWGRDSVSASMTVSYFSSGGRRQLTAFTIEQSKAGGVPGGKSATAFNAAIASALASESAVERLSPDVEAQARRLGRAIGERTVAFVKQQGWTAAPETQEAPDEAAPEEKPVRMPPVRPQRQPEG